MSANRVAEVRFAQGCAGTCGPRQIAGLPVPSGTTSVVAQVKCRLNVTAVKTQPAHKAAEPKRVAHEQPWLNDVIGQIENDCFRFRRARNLMARRRAPGESVLRALTRDRMFVTRAVIVHD